MELLLDRDKAADAPHLGRSVLLAPNRRVNLAQAGHPLVKIAPRTRLGSVALQLAVQQSIATIQIIATSTYVNALTALAPPVITFRSPPPGTKIPVNSLQQAYQDFTQKLASLQGQAANWISTSSSSGGASVFSNLISIASTIANLNATVQADFIVLANLQSGSPAWQNQLAQTKTLIGAELTPLQSIGTQIQSLSGSLNTAASTLISASSTGVLYQLQQAYQSEINALTADITNCNNKISSDNSKIVGLGFAAGSAIVVGIVGLANIWNPIGWILLAGGAAGAYFAIAEITALKGQIAELQAQIKNDINWEDADELAAQSVAAFSQSAQGVAGMNSQAQQELSTLLQLCQTLGDDITAALTDLNQDELTDALDEWNDIVSQAGFLAGITAYIWPSSIMLLNPTNLAAAGNNAWLVSNSGTTYGFTSGGTSWTTLPGYSFSVAAAGTVVAGIDGAPLDGSQLQPNSYGQSFFAKLFNAGQNAWTTISAFPVAQLATDGNSVWAINQVTSDRQAYLYSGSGTNWSAVGSMPNSDAPSAIAGANGTLFAIANNGGGLWTSAGGAWQQIGSATWSSLAANGAQVGLIDTSGNAWVMDTANGNALTAMMTGVSALAQGPQGDQYVTDGSLNLWHVALPQNGNSPVCTQLRSSIVGVSVSDGGTAYAIDNTGAAWVLTSLANNTWQQLPALPD
ncbi:MAG TPA: hypothetical protein VJS30_06870 [Paraburkholderia sp.]|nr:hypothetical protein [Paraburkholderia sp.]